MDDSDEEDFSGGAKGSFSTATTPNLAVAESDASTAEAARDLQIQILVLLRILCEHMPSLKYDKQVCEAEDTSPNASS